MKLAKKEVEVLGENLILTNQRAVFWEREAALVISDLHIGKTAHFRKNGIAVPKNIFEKDLARLSFLINEFSVKRVIISGDLLHAGDNSDVDLFCDWKRNIDAEFHLIQGNHDRISEKLKKKICLNSIQNILEVEPFAFVHEFSESSEKFQITGHVHPGIVLKTSVKNWRLPCFALAENHLLMPAFSEFTGLDTKNIPKNADFFAFTQNEIYKV